MKNPLLAITRFMNCLEQNGHIPGNLLQSHKCTTDTDTHHSVWCCRTAPRERLFTTLFSFLKSCILCSCKGGKGGHRSHAPLPVAGRPEPLEGFSAPHCDASSGSPSLTPQGASKTKIWAAQMCWRTLLCLPNTRGQGKPRLQFHLRDLPPADNVVSLRCSFLKEEKRSQSVFFLTRNFHFSDCLCCHG